MINDSTTHLTADIASQQLDALEAAALKTANKARAKLGLEPVTELSPGARGAATSCVISQTVMAGAKGVTVNTTSRGVKVQQNGTTKRIRMSLKSKRFISKFDKGGYSHLSNGRGRWSGGW
jgi:hypothetical protein